MTSLASAGLPLSSSFTISSHFDARMTEPLKENVNSTKLPPGMVLGPDGKPCKVTFHPILNLRASSPPCQLSSNVNGLNMTLQQACNNLTAFKKAFPLSTTTSSRPAPECPPDIAAIGRSTWTFLHTTASYYPLTPTFTQKTSMLSLLTSLPILYPCHTCADELKEYMRKRPPGEETVGTREGVERWLCEAHNDVNERLGKRPFDCGRVGERWRDGWKDGSCE